MPPPSFFLWKTKYRLQILALLITSMIIFRLVYIHVKRIEKKANRDHDEDSPNGEVVYHDIQSSEVTQLLSNHTEFQNISTSGMTQEKSVRKRETGVLPNESSKPQSPKKIVYPLEVYEIFATKGTTPGPSTFREKPRKQVVRVSVFSAKTNNTGPEATYTVLEDLPPTTPTAPDSPGHPNSLTEKPVRLLAKDYVRTPSLIDIRLVPLEEARMMFQRPTTARLTSTTTKAPRLAKKSKKIQSAIRPPVLNSRSKLVWEDLKKVKVSLPKPTSSRVFWTTLSFSDSLHEIHDEMIAVHPVYKNKLEIILQIPLRVIIARQHGKKSYEIPFSELNSFPSSPYTFWPSKKVKSPGATRTKPEPIVLVKTNGKDIKVLRKTATTGHLFTSTAYKKHGEKTNLIFTRPEVKEKNPTNVRKNKGKVSIPTTKPKGKKPCARKQYYKKPSVTETKRDDNVLSASDKNQDDKKPSATEEEQKQDDNVLSTSDKNQDDKKPSAIEEEQKQDDTMEPDPGSETITVAVLERIVVLACLVLIGGIILNYVIIWVSTQTPRCWAASDFPEGLETPGIRECRPVKNLVL